MAIEEQAQQTMQFFNEIYSNSPLLSTLIIEHEKELKENHITIIPTIKDKRMTNLSLVAETALLEFLFQTALNACKASDLSNKKIIIKGENQGIKKVLKISFSTHKKEKLITTLYAEIQSNYTDKIDIHYDYSHQLLNILLLF